MSLTLAGAHTMGEPLVCHISGYMRTVVYELPNLFIADTGSALSSIVHDEPHIRAALVTDPVEYAAGTGFSQQYQSDPRLQERLEESITSDLEGRRRHLYLVIQQCQDLSFSANDGQCIKVGNARDEFAIVDCRDSSMPSVDNIASTVNAVLTSVQVAFDVTAPIKTVIDHAGYTTDAGAVLHPLALTGSARLSVANPLDPVDALDRAAQCRRLASSITDSLRGRVAKGYRADFATGLEDLTDALQLEPSTDESYLRLWFLRLYHCAETFGKSCGWQFTNADAEIRDYRGDVAHKGVEQLDARIRQRCQRMIHEAVASKLQP